MQTQLDPRVKKRVPCTLNLAESQHAGLILNLSGHGMFVQTSLPAEPGTLIDIDFRDPSRDRAIALQAAVVWRRRVSPRMMGINQSGMGVRILSPTPAYGELVARILPSGPESRSVDPSGAPGTTRPTDVCSGAANAALRRYVVRLAQEGGPRSRRIVVRCDCEQRAREQALAEAGGDWSILEIAEE